MNRILRVFLILLLNLSCIVLSTKIWYDDFKDFPWNITGSTGYKPHREVVRDPLGSNDQVLKVFYPNGSLSSVVRGGCNFYVDKPQSEHVSLEYEVLFPEDFEFVKGGKLPGLFGGRRSCSGGDYALDCFMSRYMWGVDGIGYPYLYVPKNASHLPEFCALHDKKTCSPITGYNLMKADKIKYFTKGKWTNLKQVLKMNTPNQPNGRLTVWVDGKQKFDFDRIIFRTSDNVKIDGWTMQTFFGGDSSDWASIKDCYAYFKNFKYEIL